MKKDILLYLDMDIPYDFNKSTEFEVVKEDNHYLIKDVPEDLVEEVYLKLNKEFTLYTHSIIKTHMDRLFYNINNEIAYELVDSDLNYDIDNRNNSIIITIKNLNTKPKTMLIIYDKKYIMAQHCIRSIYDNVVFKGYKVKMYITSDYDRLTLKIEADTSKLFNRNENDFN